MLEGAENTPTGNNEDPDHLMYTGRLTYNFWEPEPGFYNSSTYYGKKDVLAIGLVGVYQSDGAGTAASPDDYDAWNIDFLMEKNFGWGTIDIEAAYFDYDTNDAGGSGAVFSGNSWEVGVSYLYPEKIGWGQPQIVTRYVESDPTNVPSSTWTKNKLEIALHYIIQEHNGKIALVYSNSHLGGSSADPDWNEDVSAIKLGMQFQH